MIAYRRENGDFAEIVCFTIHVEKHPCADSLPVIYQSLANQAHLQSGQNYLTCPRRTLLEAA
jgi:hypothetical protein